MKIIAFITAIILAVTMTVSSMLKPSTVEVEPPVPMTETGEPKPPNPASVIKEEIIEETVPEEIPEPTSAPEKKTALAPIPPSATTPAPKPTPVPEVITDHAKTSPEPVPEIIVDHI